MIFFFNSFFADKIYQFQIYIKLISKLLLQMSHIDLKTIDKLHYRPFYYHLGMITKSKPLDQLILK